jgi:replicative DNA helicase
MKKQGEICPVPRCDSETRNELESYIVGGLLAAAGDDPGLAGDALALCPDGSISTPGLIDVWKAVADLHSNGRKVDVLTVFDWLHAAYMRREMPKDIDGAWLAELTHTIFGYRDAVMHHAGKLADMLRRHRLHQIFTDAARECLVYGDDADAIMLQAMKKLDTVWEPQSTETLGPLLRSVLADVEKGDGSKPLPTPWLNLNAILKGGAVPGELVVLAGRPGLGKTAMAGCWAVETARKFGPVLFLSCEVKDKTLGARLLAREGKIDNRAFREGLGQSRHLLPAMRRAAARFESVPLQIVDTSSRAMRPSEIRKLARRVKGGPDMIVVDYLQLLYPDDKNQSREREIADMSREMKRLALEMDCPVLLLSQLNRKIEDTGKRPHLSDLRESGAIEQDADIVIMLHTEKKNLAEAQCPVEVLVRKGRSSGTGMVFLKFDKVCSDFVEDAAFRQKCAMHADAGNDL